MELLPAIDVRGGRCVRLLRGVYGAETVYDADPLRRAAAFLDSGARWIHVVDLDAARTGDAVNLDVVAEICRLATGRGVSVEVGGGVRSIEAASRLWDLGATRVVVGTAAVESPELVVDPVRRSLSHHVRGHLPGGRSRLDGASSTRLTALPSAPARAVRRTSVSAGWPTARVSTGSNRRRRLCL